MQDINSQVLGVSGRSTRTGKTVYDVSLADGNKYSTFDPPLAERAHALTGQHVSARVEVAQNVSNGRSYTNFNLKDIAPQGQLPPLALPAGTSIPMGQTGGGAGVSSIPMTGGGGGGADPAREARIVRQSAYGAAFAFVGRLFEGAGPEAFDQAVELAKGLSSELAAWGLGVAPQPAVVQQEAPQTVEQLAAQVPGVQVGVAGIQSEGAPPAVVPW